MHRCIIFVYLACVLLVTAKPRLSRQYAQHNKIADELKRDSTREELFSEVLEILNEDSPDIMNELPEDYKQFLDRVIARSIRKLENNKIN